MPRDFQDLKDGTVLEPYHINIIYRELRRWRRARAIPPMVIDGLESSDSPLIFRSGIAGMKFLAVANGNIPVRSGSAAGIGSVYIVSKEPTYTAGVLTAVALTTGSVSYEVYNASDKAMTSTHGIDSGMYCWVEMDDEGLLAVSPLECS